MTRQAVVFPGQGAQRPGMAADFHAFAEEAREIFARAGEVVGFDVAALCFSSDERLHLTEYTQPCILTAEIAMFAVLQHRFGFRPRYFAGHSLGEYAALTAAGVFPIETAVRLVHLRGRLMQRAVPPGVGAMAALVLDGLPLDTVRARAQAEGVEVANDNAPHQVVLSGEASAVARACERLQGELAGLRVVPLQVSAPFHCRLMCAIEPEFRAALEAVCGELKPERAKSVLSNFTGTFHEGTAEALIEALVRQLSGPVRWRENMRALIEVADEIVEVGPKCPLRGFFKALGVRVRTVTDVRSAERTFKERP